MNKNHRNIIFVLPHLRVNTTSVSRFKSIIKKAVTQGNQVTVLEFVYPLNKSIGLGQQPDKRIELEDYITDNLTSIKVKLNFIQKVAFYLLNNFNKPYWKVLNWCHQVIYNNDIFYPGIPDDSQVVSVDNHLETVVVVFGGPFGIFSYAEKIAETYKGKLILDYRDPWTYGYMPLGSFPLVYKFKKSVLRKKEVKLLEKAELVATVSDTLKSFFPLEYQHKVEVFENGTDYSLEHLNYKPETDVFSIVYLGTIYNNQLQDDVFFKAFQAFVKDKSPDKVKWYIIGAVDNHHLIKKINDYGLTNYVEITPRINRNELLIYLQKATIFLHLRYGNESGIITSKQADYLFFGKLILLPVSDCGDLSKNIIKYKAGYICNSADENYQILQSLWGKFCRKEDNSIKREEPFLSLSRKEIAVRFVEKLSSI